MEAVRVSRSLACRWLGVLRALTVEAVIVHDLPMTRIETPWGPWEAAPLGEVVALMRGLAAPWWVAGGYAIELAVGHAYREHGDVDIALLRRDQLAMRRLLDGWDV